MKEFSFSLKEYINKGLAPTDNRRNQPMLVKSTGAIPYNRAIQAMEQFTRVNTSALTAGFPYPQIFITSEFIIVCDQTAIYEMSSGGVLTQKISGLPAGSLWSMVHFKLFLYFVNGQCSVMRDPNSGEYSRKLPDIDDVPYGNSVCNYNGQLILGNPVEGIDINSVEHNVSTITVSTEISASFIAGQFIFYIAQAGAGVNFAYSNDFGISFSTTGAVSAVTLGSTNSVYVVDGTSAYAAYGQSGASPIFAKTTNTGSSWTETTINPAIATTTSYTNMSAYDDNNVFVTYRDAAFNWYCGYSSNGGTTWGNSLIGNLAVGVSPIGIAAESATIVHAVGYAGIANGLKYSKSTDGGANWSALSTIVAGDSNYPSINVYGSDILVTYTIASLADLYFIKYSSGAWGSPVLVSGSCATNFRSLDTADGTVLYIAYTSSGQLKYAKSTDGGATWPTDSAIDGSVSPSNTQTCIYVVDNLTVYISVGNGKFYFTTDGGGSWNTRVTGITGTLNSVGSSKTVSL